MENSILFNDDTTRSNIIYNLSGADSDFGSLHSDSGADNDDSGADDDDSGADNDDDDNDEDDERNVEYVPTASWFTMEELVPTISLIIQRSALDAIQTSHIRESRNYRVLKSDATRYEAKCVIDECPWRIRL
ncbi:hypothetical protein OROGR_015283 [Orobanche gracilis]